MKALMTKVILDTNFLFVPVQFQIDIFEQLNNLLGKAEPIVLSTTIEELESLVEKRSGKIRSQAVMALKLARRCRIIEVEKTPEEGCDDVIVRKAREWNCLVATNDANMRRKLREAKVATVFMRQRSHLAIEGQVSV